MRCGWTWMVVALVSWSLTGSASADEASDRRELISKVDRTLEEIAKYIEDVERDSSSSDIDQALRKVDELSSLLSKLKDVRGDDSTAKQMADRYPGYQSKLREALQHLRKHKDGQESLDRLPAQCEVLKKDLNASMEDYVRKKSPEGLDEVPKLAEKAQRKVDEHWREAEKKKREMEDLRSRAGNFSESDGKWSSVSSELRESAQDTYRGWEDDWKSAEKSCQDLRRGRQNPDVEKKMSELSQFSKGRDELFKELERHLRDASNGVKRIDSESNGNKLSEALRAADNIAGVLGKLKYAKGSDRRAGEVAHKWRNSGTPTAGPIGSPMSSSTNPRPRKPPAKFSRP